MKLNHVITTFLLTFACLTNATAQADASGNTSTITGVVNHCDKGGIAGMMVYIPGKPYLVITGSNGKFQFDNVAAGDYTIYFMLNGNIMNYNKWIDVTAEKVNKLGEISFCDKVTSKIPPGGKSKTMQAAPAAEQQQQNIPSNLKTHCKDEKDGTVVAIINGTGSCLKGAVVIKKCNKGYSNCDANAANGCETDIMNDDENCGECFNACSDTESCQLGFC